MKTRKKQILAALATTPLLAASLLGASAPASAASLTTLHINAGGSAFTDVSGDKFVADTYAIGGGVNKTTAAIKNTSNQTLYKDEHWGASGYKIPVTNGVYTLILRFAEINPNSGDRVQTVTAEGQTLLKDYNTKAAVGAFTADMKTFKNVAVTDGFLDLGLTATKNSTSIASISVIPQAALPSTAAVVPTTVAPTTTTAAPTTTTTAAPTTTTAAPTTTTTAAPTTTTAAPIVSSSPSGQAMPVGDLPGWKQVFTDDFKTNAPVGTFMQNYGTKWNVYADGWDDTWNANGNGIGKYYPSKVVSVNNGVLNKYLHSENGTAMVAALLPRIPKQTYGRYDVRFRADSLPGYKTAWLLWPDTDKWSEGEIDFAEGDLNHTMSAFNHCIGAPQNNCYYANTNTTFTGWHTTSIEWMPGKLNFLIDGKLIGSTTKSVPATPFHWVLQTEEAATKPSLSTAGNLQIDWVAAYSYAG